MKRFSIWYMSDEIPKGFAIVEASTPGEAINSMRNVTVVRCREIPGTVFTVETMVKIADALNNQLADGAMFISSVYLQEWNTLAIVSHATRRTFDLFQCADARSLYYATRRQLRRLNHEVSE